MPSPNPVPNGQSAKRWYNLNSLLNLAPGSHKPANAKFLVHCGSKTNMASFECVWENASEFTEFTAPWLDVMDLMAARIELDSPEAIPITQRCIDFFFTEKLPTNKGFFRKLCSPPFLGKMRLCTPPRYLDKLNIESNEGDLDELRYVIGWCEVTLQNEIQKEGENDISATDTPIDCLSSLAFLRQHGKVQQEIVEILREATLYFASPERLSGLGERN